MHRAATLDVRARSARRRRQRGKGIWHSVLPLSSYVRAVPSTGLIVSSMQPRAIPCQCMRLDWHRKRLEHSRGTLAPENLAVLRVPHAWRAESQKPPRATSIRLRAVWQGLPDALFKGTFQDSWKR